MKKSIGIMSMQRIVNYGSFLQAYALKRTIELLGDFKVTFVDYRVGAPITDTGKEKKMVFKNRIVRAFKTILSRIVFLHSLLPPKIRHSMCMNRYYRQSLRNHLRIGKKRNYAEKVDLLIIGSDEVFNCTQLNPDVGYSLSLFGKSANAPRVISYAASFGNTTLEKLEKCGKISEIASCLNNFSDLSVRDRNSFDIICHIAKVTPQIHLDPVLIYDFEKEINNLQSTPFNNYVLVYAYRGRISDSEQKRITDFAKKEKKKILCIGGYHKFADKNIVCSPFEVLGYFKRADYVFTDTFHGTIFSIINHKKFVTFVRNGSQNGYGNAEKLNDLLIRLNLENRSVHDNDDVDAVLKADIDYAKIDRIIEAERDKTLNYFKGILFENA